MRVVRVAASARRSCSRIAKASSIACLCGRKPAPELSSHALALADRQGHRLDRREIGKKRVDLEGSGQAMAHPRRRRHAGDVLPASRMRPESGRSCPVIRLISVVLPAPFGPISA